MKLPASFLCLPALCWGNGTGLVSNSGLNKDFFIFILRLVLGSNDPNICAKLKGKSSWERCSVPVSLDRRRVLWWGDRKGVRRPGSARGKYVVAGKVPAKSLPQPAPGLEERPPDLLKTSLAKRAVPVSMASSMRERRLVGPPSGALPWPLPVRPGLQAGSGFAPPASLAPQGTLPFSGASLQVYSTRILPRLCRARNRWPPDANFPPAHTKASHATFGIAQQHKWAQLAGR